MFKALKEGLSTQAKVIIAVVLVVIVAGGAFGAYKLWDYKENNPSFCMSCHLMKDAFDKWAVSEHKDVNCHDCHHLSIIEQNQLLISLVLHNPKEVPKRHGKIIVPWTFCVKCHWESDPRFPDAPKVNESPGHAKHFFQEKVECSQCHGYKLHVFTAEPRFCVKCHPKNDEVHGMPSLACLACHTDKTADLLPTRDKCLACHGSKEQRVKIAAEPATMDTRHFQPTEEEVAKASKLSVFPPDGAMQFECSKCHQPHGKMFLKAGTDCLPCHRNVPQIGKHQMHFDSGFKCLDCHKPHLWKVTKQVLAQKKCTQCHGVGKPENFLK